MNPLVWVVLGSTFLTGLFALLSYSLRELRRVQLEAAFGPDGRERLSRLERNLTALRLTAALGRSLASLVLVVAMLTLLEAQRGGWERVAGAAALAAGFIAIFGVAIPHAWASYAGEKVLASCLGLLTFFRYLLYPVIAVMQAFDLPIRRLSGAAAPDEQTEAKQEILEAAVEGAAEGAVKPDEVRMIRRVIEFGQRQAGEIMTPRTDIFALPAGTAWALACREVFAAGHTRVPLYEGDLDNIVGMLYAKDLLQHVGRDEPLDVRPLMRKCFFVPETKRLDDLLREFKTRKVHIAVVLDEYGGTAGLVSFEDVLEEIVGEISDEYDGHEPALMKRLDDRTAEMDGRMYIDDLKNAMHLPLPEDADYDTVAGLIFSELGYIPAAGERLDAFGARFTVLAADERRITRVRVEKLPPGRKDA